ncbi:HIT domain-containing protein [Frigoribacterium sp. CFBP9039]|uniref:HIT family protein n=1 Tax=unclassified Frigoribacterium TaxID=2627005 RepID=UPI002A6ACB1B|nr:MULTISPECIES: HIT domain-containing protein [unclassified Frigoribacterium]MDY0891082.1 HIT domain-containing protein [Frigoribacterium sp. CFBP9030]MDY0944959.1 HIT domain-containing protein [Frigoribacterium sp. CFBP9039]
MSDPAATEASGDFAAVPDAFQRLWTPHRAVYVGQGQGAHDDDCPFCEAPSKSDDDALIVARGEHAYVVLNLFPYNPGHLLVCPYRHVATYDLATVDEVTEIAALTQIAMRVLTVVSRAQGFNIGMNQGQVGGAGIAEHLHQHIVPRYGGDSNFFPIIAETKAVTRLLGDVRAAVAEAWPATDRASDPSTTRQS